MLLLAVVYAIFASTFTIGQMALGCTRPVFLITVRMLLAGILLLGYVYFFKRDAFKKFNVKLFILISIFHIYIPYVFEFWGLQYVGAAKAALLYSIMPFVTALFEHVLFNFKLTRNRIVGMIVGLVGFLPLLLTGAHCEAQTTKIFFLSTAEIAILISAVSSCLGWILIKKSIIEKQQSTLFANGIGMLGGGFLALITSLLVEPWNPLPTDNLGNTLMYVSVLILVGNFLYYNVHGVMLHYYSATFLSFFGFTIPIFAALYQWIIFRELVSWQFMLTSACTIIGLYIFYRDELVKKKVTPEQDYKESIS